MSEQEQAPFLGDCPDNSDNSLQDHITSCSSTKSVNNIWSPAQRLSVAANMLLLITCVILTAIIAQYPVGLCQTNVQNTANDDEIPELYSPAADAIEYQYRAIIPNDTRFTGHPGPEWEQSIHGLMEATLIRISEEELKQSNSDSIPLKDGGYAAGLGIGHNLHCVKKIKQFIYREYFYPDLSKDKDHFDYVQAHADHCLDFLRQDMLCHVDYTLYTLYWGERRQDIPTHQIPKYRKCVNWDKLHLWMQSRAANTDMLVRP
ncbi:hypothetical protein GGS20DRAFT_369052 [Poronia punctata]|nr:hypothetical protein GGS20DRAFT_369052 [Poronia punctata]